MSLTLLFGEHRVPVYVALVLGLLLRIVFVLETPFNKPVQIGTLSAYNDEAAHVGFTVHLLEAGSLPRTVAPITSEYQEELPTWENYQSPLYYILHSLACRALKVSNSQAVAEVGRWLSVLFMFVTIAVAMRILASLGKAVSNRTAALAIIFLALSGVFVRFSTLSGNEMLAWLIVGWLAWAFVEHERYASTRNLSWLMIAFILGVYVKLSLLIASPLIAIALVKSYRLAPSKAVIAGLYLIVGCMPLALYNHFTFGSAIPIAAGFGNAAWQMPGVSSFLYAARSAIFPWSELWQGWKGVLLFIPASVFVAIVFVSALSKPKSWQFALTLSALVGFVWLNFRYAQAEARYLFVAWPGLLLGFQFSLARFISPWTLLLALLLPYTLFVF